MSDSTTEEFKKLIESTFLSENDIPHLTNIANDLRITKSDIITKIIMDRLTVLKTDNLIITIFKLIDSILCNVTTPYNDKFSEPLSFLFKKKYLVLNNANRQVLITIFESWVEKSNQSLTKSNQDEDMFEDFEGQSEFLSKSTLKNIETFLIKASLLHEKRFLEKTEREGINSKAVSKSSNLKYESNNVTPSVNDLLQIIRKIDHYMRESLNKQFSEDIQQRLHQIHQVQELLSSKKFNNENEIIEIFNKLKSIPEYSQVVNLTQETDERVNNFIKKSKIAKMNEIKSLLEDFKVLNHENDKEETPSLLTQTWTSDKYQNAVKSFCQKTIENEQDNELSKEQSFEKNNQKLPDLTLLTNINKDLQASKLKMSDFVKIEIKNENLAEWSKYIQLMYRNIPEKCLFCGKRFPLTKQKANNSALNANKRTFMLLNASNNDDDSALLQNDESKKLIEQHMDWHYETINKSQIMTKTGIKKMMVNRTWFGANSYLSALKQNTEDLFSEEGDLKRRKVDEGDSSRDVDVKYVVVPKELMGQLNEIECAICRDTIKVSFIESIGEWCMIDCKETHQGYVHLSCLH